MAAEHAEASGTAAPGARPSAWPSHSGLGSLTKGTRVGALSLVLMLLPGVLAGGSLLAAAQVYAFFLAWVLLPGLACAALLHREEDELAAAGVEVGRNGVG